ncbi:tetratricopeptide repeat protein, partial [Zarconia navalis]|uniref:tetratricopeptide repeat protein n=1 Tax=Zarconia navalis TaxID=2992134 RepID=UPI0021F820B4
LQILALGVTNCLAETERLGTESDIPLPQQPTDYAEAIACYQQNIQFARQVGDAAREGYALHNLGVAYHATGYYNRAIEFPARH